MNAKKRRKGLLIVCGVIAGTLLLFFIIDTILKNREEKPLVGINETKITNQEEKEKEEATQKKRVVAYFASWAAYDRKVLISDIEPQYITHLNFAFANLSPEGTILVGDPKVDIQMSFSEDYEYPDNVAGHFGEMNRLKEEYPLLKTLISVGGWSWSEHFSEVASSEQKRKEFARSAVTFITEYGFDGIDIDWEFPVAGGPHTDHRPEDKENFTLLLKEVREALNQQSEMDKKEYLLTIAAGVEPDKIHNLEVKEIMQYIDFMNVMSYNYHGSWEEWTNHNAPLYLNSSSDTFEKDTCIDDTIKGYLANGAEPSKLNLGIPFYGYAWYQVEEGDDLSGLFQPGCDYDLEGHRMGTYAEGELEYWDIAQNYVNKSGFKRYYDEVAKVPYLYNGDIFITYEDCTSVGEKIAYTEKEHLGGLMFWEFSQDKEKELQSFMYEHYLSKE